MSHDDGDDDDNDGDFSRLVPRGRVPVAVQSLEHGGPSFKVSCAS